MVQRRNILQVAGAVLVAGMTKSSWGMARNRLYRFTMRNGRLFVATRINGVAIEALLDSGAEATVVDSAAAARLGLSGGTPVEVSGSGAARQAARFISGVGVEAFGLKLMPGVIAVTDLSDVSRRLASMPLQAIIGREIFDAARLRIDFAASTIEVFEGAPMRGIALPLTAVHGIEAVPIRLAGHEAVAVVDTGNGSRPMVSAALAERAGLLEGRAIGSAKGGGIGGEKVMRTVRLNGLEIGGRRFDDVEFSIDDKPHAPDANIGTSLLSAFTVTFDYPGRILWLGPR